MSNSVNPEQTAPIGAVCSGSTLFASILSSSVILGNYLQQTTFFLAQLSAKSSNVCWPIVIKFNVKHEVGGRLHNVFG